MSAPSGRCEAFGLREPGGWPRFHRASTPRDQRLPRAEDLPRSGDTAARRASVAPLRLAQRIRQRHSSFWFRRVQELPEGQSESVLQSGPGAAKRRPEPTLGGAIRGGVAGRTRATPLRPLLVHSSVQ